jgi:hypothetical protein
MMHSTPFRYRPESHVDELRLRKEGWKIIEFPKAGDKVVGFAWLNDSSNPIYVKTNTSCHHRVSRWFNKQSREWSEDNFIFYHIPSERTSKP